MQPPEFVSEGARRFWRVRRGLLLLRLGLLGAFSAVLIHVLLGAWT